MASKCNVRFTNCLGAKDRCEIADLLIITYASKERPLRATFWQAKKSQNQNGHHLIQKFANLISKPNSINGTCWRGGQKLMAGKFTPPTNLLSDARSSSIELLVRSMNVTEKLSISFSC
jgi:hypothetical protein